MGSDYNKARPFLKVGEPETVRWKPLRSQGLSQGSHSERERERALSVCFRAVGGARTALGQVFIRIDVFFCRGDNDGRDNNNQRTSSSPNN